MSKKNLPSKEEWEKNMQRILEKHVKLREKQIKDGTLCYCGATTPEEHLGTCDYCWEGSHEYYKEE